MECESGAKTHRRVIGVNHAADVHLIHSVSLP
jgi:hypothetical protein